MNELPRIPQIKWRPDDPQPECDERLYWHKRFNFASWLFLFLGLYLIFASSTAKASIIAFSVSIGFRVFNSIHRTRHMFWHMQHGRGDDTHL